jgi:hypothetical protein
MAVISGHPRRWGLRARELFEDEMVAIVSPKIRWRRAPSFDPPISQKVCLVSYAVPAQLTPFQEFCIRLRLRPPASHAWN